MHIVSTVTGEVAPEHDALDVLRRHASRRARCPARRSRGRWRSSTSSSRPGAALYGGVVGYLDFAGDMDMAIAIRTALLRDGTRYVQAGAGIVADSDPATEEAETRNKARGGAVGDRDGGGPAGAPVATRRRELTAAVLGAVGAGALALVAGGQAWAQVTAQREAPLPPVTAVALRRGRGAAGAGGRPGAAAAGVALLAVRGRAARSWAC